MSISRTKPDSVVVPPRALVYPSALQSITSGSNNTVLYGAESYDTHSMHSVLTDTGRITIPINFGGIWNFGYSVLFAAGAATSVVAVWMEINAPGGQRYGFAQVSNNAASGAIVFGSSSIVLAAGDYVSVQAFQNSGGALNLNGASTSYGFWGYYVGRS